MTMQEAEFISKGLKTRQDSDITHPLVAAEARQVRSMDSDPYLGMGWRVGPNAAGRLRCVSLLESFDSSNGHLETEQCKS